MKKQPRNNDTKTEKTKKSPVIIKLNSEDLDRVAGGLSPFIPGRCPPATW